MTLSRFRSDTPEVERATQVILALSKAVNAFVADVDADAFEVRPPWPGAGEAWGRNREPLPLPAIEAAQVVLAEAKRLEAKTISHARGRGETWTAIGKALGKRFVDLAKREGMSLAEATWRYAAYRILPDQEIAWRGYSSRRDVVRWKCWTCHQDIEEGHPDLGPDAEEGHRISCERLARRKKAGFRR